MSRRRRLWRGSASERASRGLSAAADPPSQGAPLAARPPLPRVPRRERRRRSVRPSLTCREVRLLLLRTAAARCPCLPSHRPHAGPRASNHCSAGARSLAPVSSITRHKISSPFALFWRCFLVHIMDYGQTVNGGQKLFMYHDTVIIGTYWIIELCTWGMWKGITCLVYEFLLDIINYQIRFLSLLNKWLVSVTWWTNEAAKMRCDGAGKDESQSY